MKTILFRALRQSCRITQAEIARAMGVSYQRIGQVELGRPNHRPNDPERLITALESVASKRRDECDKALRCCKTMRNRMFEVINGEAEA